MSLLLAFQGAGPPAVTGTVAQAQKKQAQGATGAESFLASVAQVQKKQTQAITAAEAMLASVAQAQKKQAQSSTGIVLVAVTATVAQSQDRQTQAATAAESMLATVAQAQVGQAQAATAVEAMLGIVVQEQAGQQQAALGAVLANIVGQVAQAQPAQGQQIGAASVVSVVSGGGALPIIRRRGKTFYITISGGKRKKPVRVEVKVVPKPPEEDRRHVLEALRRLAEIRLPPKPALPKIEAATIRRAVRHTFAVTGTVQQAQAPAAQASQAKVTRPDEELLLLLIA